MNLRDAVSRRVDEVVALALVAYGALDVWVLGPTNLVGPRWGLWLAVTVAALALVWRRRVPLTVQVVVVLALAPPALTWGASQAGSTLLPLVVATYAVGRHGERPRAYLGVPVAVIAGAVQVALDPMQGSVSDAWAWPLLGGVMWGAGAWVRQRGQLERRREAERAALTRQAIAEERTRIARDLHDVLAHSLGAMVVQAEAAEEMLDRDPAQARRPMQRVQAAGREALGEVRTLLGVLRIDGEQTPSRSPRDVADIPLLVSRLRAAGLPIDFLRDGDAYLPPVTGQTVFHVAQEALTNVVRHAGSVPTRVRLCIAPGELRLDVENDGPRIGSPPPPGLGLLGMRERVEACGGVLRSGPRAAGGFTVNARIPLPRGDVT